MENNKLNMDQKAVFNYCKELGCCNMCCIRYLGIKNPNAYEDIHKFVHKYQDETLSTSTDPQKEGEPPNASESSSDMANVQQNGTNTQENGTSTLDNNTEGPLLKKRKLDYCISCLGLLQEETWPMCFATVKEMLEKKQYECKTFACALSAPITTLLRENAIGLMLVERYPDYNTNVLTPLKEAWKWSFGSQLAVHINKTLDSGAVSPLLITINMEYADDLQELEILKTISAPLFESRSKQKKRFTVEFTRRSVEQALETVTLEALRGCDSWKSGLPTVSTRITCVSVICTHAPGYLGGRYIKLSRELPQTPWLVNGKRMMESSVQEIIFEPIAKLYGMSPEDAEHRLKFMSAGREDVDVRCLGDGRPFAIEVTDPTRELTDMELQQVCAEISKSGKVVVKKMVSVTKDDLTELKKGEETKSKTYEALCIKLLPSDSDVANGDTRVTVTPADIANINTYRNTGPEDAARIILKQKTPIRVLHRRPLLNRSRKILELSGVAVEGHPQLFVVRVRTEAGTYVKEWVHGECGRTRPALGHAVGAQVDILALDVARVDLDWPKSNK